MRRFRTAGALVAAAVVVVACSSDDDGSADEAEATAPPTTEVVLEPIEVPEITVVDVGPVEEVPPRDPERGTLDGSPLDDLPDDVRQLVDFGQRPDWSPDGSEIVFLDASPLGNVWSVDVATGETRELTGHLDQQFTRAYHLSNGDLLLCGPTSGPEPSAEQPEAGRFTGVMSVFRAPFDGVPEPLGISCWEGMATSSSSMRIAWNRSDIDYTDDDLADRVINGITEIWTGEVRDVGGVAAVVGARKVLDRDTLGFLSVLEVQGFRPPDDEELLFTTYAYQGGEVFGLELATGEVRNHSNSSAYEEAEGIDPSGDSVLVERDLVYEDLTPGALDIWRLQLDDGSFERLTTFNRWAPYYASNPSISPDGSTLAFQLSIDGEVEGRGDGILLMDLAG
jgi:hypothetical protein